MKSRFHCVSPWRQRIFRSRTLLILASLVRLAANHRSAFGQIAQNPPIPDGFGVTIHFTQPQPGELDRIYAGGFRWIRTDLVWSGTEKKQGVYDFSAYDGLIQALSRHHLRAMLILGYANPLYDHGLSPYTDAGQEAFARWAVAAVHHFRGHGILWEVYNEPNNAPFWRPKVNVQDYVRLALRVGEAVKESDPGETLVGPASSLVDLRYLAFCFRAGLLNYWSAVTVHPYRQRYPETVAPEFYAVRWLIAKYAPPGKQIPVIPGEWGYSSVWKWDGMNNQMQARLLAREFLFNLADGVPLTIWYDWKNDNLNPDDPEGHFGLVYVARGPDGQVRFPPKPAYQAAKALYEALDGFTFERRLHLEQEADYVLVFEKGDQTRLAAWTTSGKPHRVQIQGATGKFSVTSLMGVKLKTCRAHRHRLTLTLGDDPIYLIPRKRQNLKPGPSSESNARPNPQPVPVSNP